MDQHCQNLRTIGTRNLIRRNEWVVRHLKAIPSGSRLLDAGAGEMPYKSDCSHLQYVSQDFCQYDGIGDMVGLQTLRWERKGIDIVCDIARIPEPDCSFDAILCSEVLEHLPEPITALREFSRLLKPGGQLLLTAPFCSLTHFAPYHYHTGFSRYFYEKHLPSLGFAITGLEFNGNYFEYMAQEMRRLHQTAAKYCTRRSRLMSQIARGAVGLLLLWLASLSNRDQGSSELLSYGLHVHALRTKRGAGE